MLAVGLHVFGVGRVAEEDLARVTAVRPLGHDHLVVLSRLKAPLGPHGQDVLLDRRGLDAREVEPDDELLAAAVGSMGNARGARDAVDASCSVTCGNRDTRIGGAPSASSAHRPSPTSQSLSARSPHWSGSARRAPRPRPPVRARLQRAQRAVWRRSPVDLTEWPLSWAWLASLPRGGSAGRARLYAPPGPPDRPSEAGGRRSLPPADDRRSVGVGLRVMGQMAAPAGQQVRCWYRPGKGVLL